MAFGLSPPWPVLSFDGKALKVFLVVCLAHSGYMGKGVCMFCGPLVFVDDVVEMDVISLNQTSAEFGFHSSFLLLCNWWKKKVSTRGANSRHA